MMILGFGCQVCGARLDVWTSARNREVRVFCCDTLAVELWEENPVVMLAESLDSLEKS